METFLCSKQAVQVAPALLCEHPEPLIATRWTHHGRIRALTVEPSRITWCHAQPVRSGTFPDIEMSTDWTHSLRVLNPKLLAAKRLTIANFSGSGGLHFSGFAQQVFVLQVCDDHASSTFSTLLRRRRLSSCDASAIQCWQHGPLLHWHHPSPSYCSRKDLTHLAANWDWEYLVASNGTLMDLDGPCSVFNIRSWWSLVIYVESMSPHIPDRRGRGSTLLSTTIRHSEWR